MSEIPSANSEIQEREIVSLAAYIDRGLDLIKAERSELAYDHFALFQKHSDDSPDVRVKTGRIFPIAQLRSEEELVQATRIIAQHSWAYTKQRAEIGWWFVGKDLTVDTTFEDNTALFHPDLVGQFRHEVAVVAAEEWLHMLQFAAGSTSLAGYDNVEIDVTASLYERGVYLSPDFLTRYPERAIWAMEKHPERTDEILEFIARNQQQAA